MWRRIRANKCVTSCETNLDTAYCAHIGFYLTNFVKILLIVSSYIEPRTYYIFGVQNLLTFQVIQHCFILDGMCFCRLPICHCGKSPNAITASGYKFIPMAVIMSCPNTHEMLRGNYNIPIIHIMC